MRPSPPRRRARPPRQGRVSCEINTADELVVTELIFNGSFSELSAAQAAALLSCLVFEEKSGDETPLTDDLKKPFQMLQASAAPPPTACGSVCPCSSPSGVPAGGRPPRGQDLCRV